MWLSLELQLEWLGFRGIPNNSFILKIQFFKSNDYTAIENQTIHVRPSCRINNARR